MDSDEGDARSAVGVCSGVRVRPRAPARHRRLLLGAQTEVVTRSTDVSVDGDGQVHFAILPGSLDKNRHLLGRTLT